MKGSANPFRQFFAELAANSRLGWGIWLILLLLLGYAIQFQRERLANVQKDYEFAVERLAEVEALLDRGNVLDMLDAEGEKQDDVLSMFWHAETEGLAQAKLQAEIGQMFGALGFADVHFRSGSSHPAPDLAGVWRIRIRMDANYVPGSEPRIFHALATHPRKLNVDRLDLRRFNANEAYVVLDVSAYFVGLAMEADEPAYQVE